MDDCTDAFVEACAAGDAYAAASFLSSWPGMVDVHWNEDAAFRAACGGGSEQMVTWLHAVISPDLQTCGPRAFTMACEAANTGAVQALWGLGVGTSLQNISDGLRWCLRTAACYDDAHQRVQCLQLLWEAHGAFDIHENGDWVYKEAHDSGHAEVLEWVKAKGGPLAHWPVRVGECALRWEQSTHVAAST
jgi:hypothetical protein